MTGPAAKKDQIWFIGMSQTDKTEIKWNGSKHQPEEGKKKKKATWTKVMKHITMDVPGTISQDAKPTHWKKS